MNLNILHTREVKEIRRILFEEFGFDGSLDYNFLKSEKKKVYLSSKDLGRVDLDKLRINSMGLYFGEMKDGRLRLSLEGTQLIGPKSTKNVLVLDERQMKWYFSGADLDMDLGGENRFVLLKFRDDFIGCAKYKEGKLLNFMPKEQRTNDLVY